MQACLSHFRVDYVNLPPERTIGLHSQPTWELVLNIRGGGMRTIGATTLPISSGEVILVPPWMPHVWDFDTSDTDADGNISHVAMMFDSDVLRQLAVIFPEMDNVVNTILSFTQAIEIHGAEKKELTNLLLDLRHRSPLGQLPVIIEALTVLGRVESSVSVGVHATLTRHEAQLERLRTYCVCNMGRSLSLEDATAYMGMSKSAFCSFVRRATGSSFTEYVNAMRLNKASLLLAETDERISIVAYQVGFTDVPYFNRRFKARFGLSPSAFRHRKM